MPGEPCRQNPTSGSDAVRRVHTHRRRRHAWPRSPTPSTATRRPGAPLAGFNGIDDPLRVRSRHPCCCCPSPEELGRDRCRITSTFLVEIDGTPLPADVAPLLVAAYVDDSQQLPDTVRAAVPRPRRIGAGQVRGQGRVRGQDLASVAAAPAARAADHRRGHRARGRVRHRRHVHRDPGYDPAHRLFRGRRTETYTQMTASDIATKVAQRAGLQIGEVTSTTTVFDHVQPGRHDRLGVSRALAADDRLEVAVRDGKFDFGPPDGRRPPPRRRAAPRTRTRWC